MDVGNGIIRISPEFMGDLLKLPPMMKVTGAFTIDEGGWVSVAIRVRDKGREGDELHEYKTIYKSTQHVIIDLHSIDSSPL